MRLERRPPLGFQRPQRDALRPCLSRRQQNLGAAYREGERARSRALHKGAPFDVRHGLSSRGSRALCSSLELVKIQRSIGAQIKRVAACRPCTARSPTAALQHARNAEALDFAQHARRVLVAGAELAVGIAQRDRVHARSR